MYEKISKLGKEWAIRREQEIRAHIKGERLGQHIINNLSLNEWATLARAIETVPKPLDPFYMEDNLYVFGVMLAAAQQVDAGNLSLQGEREDV